MQEKLRKILNHYGEEAQSKKYIEKLSKLMIAIIKGDIKNIKEEIADVKVMTKQFLMFKGVEIVKYERWVDYLFEYASDVDDEDIEFELKVNITRVLESIIRGHKNSASGEIAGLEYLLDRYMDINNISKEEIEKEMERKINRQLERIEREKSKE